MYIVISLNNVFYPWEGLSCFSLHLNQNVCFYRFGLATKLAFLDRGKFCKKICYLEDRRAPGILKFYLNLCICDLDYVLGEATARFSGFGSVAFRKAWLEAFTGPQ